MPKRFQEEDGSLQKLSAPSKDGSANYPDKHSFNPYFSWPADDMEGICYFHPSHGRDCHGRDESESDTFVEVETHSSESSLDMEVCSSDQDVRFVKISSSKGKLCLSDEAKDTKVRAYDHVEVCSSEMDVKVCSSVADVEVCSFKSGDGGAFSSTQDVRTAVKDSKANFSGSAASAYSLEKTIDAKPTIDAKGDSRQHVILHPIEDDAASDQAYSNYVKYLRQRWTTITASPDCITLEEYMERLKVGNP